jgi:hypothetical protein
MFKGKPESKEVCKLLERIKAVERSGKVVNDTLVLPGFGFP